MSSPQQQQQIPNLLETLRASRPPRGRGTGPRRRGAGSAETPADAAPDGRGGDGGKSSSSDAIVQQTDDDAAGARLSAVRAGYLDDGFAEAFAAPERREAGRRMPIMNRGTYVRTTAIDALVAVFLSSPAVRAHRDTGGGGGRAQIVSLGAGSDTRFFRLAARDPAFAPGVAWHELDFAATTARKLRAVRESASAMAVLRQGGAEVEVEDGAEELVGEGFSVHALDLAQLAPSPSSAEAESAKEKLRARLHPTAPTLLLAECSLTYLPPAASTAALAALCGDLLRDAAALRVVLYEPVGPEDAFGARMRENLSIRGIRLPGMEAWPSVEAQRARLLGAEALGGVGEGWVVQAEGCTVREWWDRRVDAGEKERLRGLEMVDEEEEWELLAGHYGIVWGWRERG